MVDMQKQTPSTKQQLRLYLLLFIVFALLSACSSGETSLPEDTATAVIEEPTSTEVPEEPSATPIPAAAIVNGERISLAFFESEFERYRISQEAEGLVIEDETLARDIVLNDLIDQVLLAQGAGQAGLTVSDEDVRARIDALKEEIDLDSWMATWGYTEDSLFEALRLQMLAALQRDAIAESVPEVMEQVNLQQVFAYTEEGAKSALTSLRSGRVFDDVAFTYDPVTGGYIGWVPMGYLLVPAVEEAAFGLPVGEYSDVIESDVGYHIVLVLAREERPLSVDAMLTLQRQAVHTWLAEQRANSTIEVLGD
jgi:parvulin-like peptidyl-prolyl isomerase